MKNVMLIMTTASLLSLAIQTVATAEEPALIPVGATPNTETPTSSVAKPEAQTATPSSTVMGGGQLATPEELREQNLRIMNARTPQERWALMVEQQRQMQERAAKQAAQSQGGQGQAAPYGGDQWRTPQHWTWQSGANYGPGYAYDYGYYNPGYGPPQTYWHGYCPNCPQMQAVPSLNQMGPGTGNQSPKPTCVPNPQN